MNIVLAVTAIIAIADGFARARAGRLPVYIYQKRK